MFFCPELLLKRGHPFFVVWIAATQKGERLNKYLTTRKVAKLDVYHVIEDVLRRVIVTSTIPRKLAMHNGCFSLYLSAQLMFGCCVALNRKATILINDLGRISKNLKKMRFSSEKSQMVLQFPNKSGKKGGINENNNPFQLAGRQLCDTHDDFRNMLETLSAGNILEIIVVDDGEQEPLEFTHSVPENSITMEEIQFSAADEDTHFGDEGDGGRGFIDFLNGDKPVPETRLVNSDALSQHDTIGANFDQQSAGIELSEPVVDPSIGNIRTSSQINASGVDLAVSDSAPTGSLEPEPKGVELPKPVEDLQIDNIRTSSPTHVSGLDHAVEDSAPTGSFEPEPKGIELPKPVEDLQIGNARTSSSIHASGVDPAVKDSAPSGSLEFEPKGLPWRMSKGRLSGIASVMSSELELQPTLPELEHDAITGRISEPHSDEIAPEPEQSTNAHRIYEDHIEEIAPNILPLPDQDDNAGTLPEARPNDDIPIQPTQIQGDSDMELSELLDVPATGRKRKRPTYLTIDETIEIPSSIIRRRIENMAGDTLRKEDSYEDCMAMLFKVKWLNLDQLRLPGRLGLGQSRPLASLFSRHLVTRPDPRDDDNFDLDRTLNQRGRRESFHATPHASSPVTIPPSVLESRNQTETLDALTMSPERTSKTVLDKTSAPPGEIVETIDALISSPEKMSETVLDKTSAPPGEIIETIDAFISSPEKMSETVLHKTSTPLGGRFDSLNEPFIAISPFGQEEGRPGSLKRRREKSQSLDHLILPSPKRQSVTETVVEVSANKEVAASESSKFVEGFHDEETGTRAEVAELFHDPSNLADAREQDVLDPTTTGLTMNSVEMADSRAQDIPGHVGTANLSEILQGQETVTVCNSEEGTKAFPDEIPIEGVEDADGGRQTEPKHRRQESGVDVDKDSVGDSSSSSLGPNVLQNVLDSACELARERSESTIPIAVLCPPSTRRRRAAGFFGALLDLHMKKQVTLHQDKDELMVGPISITVNEIS
ncbi:uncharacterized protein LOC117653156 [Thrips palmi]|uniref:Uncharacterized protein LOC117653156 n=1 Tax=Thrips palmi TaxID=161013 RepID=A0A6P9A8Z7_THRPL|nr:uncharacterized protein LOC117653156 [Thrips palmi]XP_034254493.1 uncharacterized protein LOC117653156 [Thrips palmi]